MYSLLALGVSLVCSFVLSMHVRLLSALCLLSLPPADWVVLLQAEKIAARMVAQDRMKGSIDQVG
jgi:hypothetical protein